MANKRKFNKTINYFKAFPSRFGHFGLFQCHHIFTILWRNFQLCIALSEELLTPSTLHTLESSPCEDSNGLHYCLPILACSRLSEYRKWGEGSPYPSPISDILRAWNMLFPYDMHSMICTNAVCSPIIACSCWLWEMHSNIVEDLSNKYTYYILFTHSWHIFVG
jgi:hypothetical protein